MAIEKPGRRLFKKIRLPKVRKSLTSKGGRSVVASLNLTAMVDMMTVLVTFLMMLFNATGDILAADKDIKMPKAFSGSDLQRALLVQVSKTAVKLEGKVVFASPDLSNPKANAQEITKPLSAILKEKDALWDQKNPDKKDEQHEIIIQADSFVDYIAIARVSFACAKVGYSKINLAVESAIKK